MAAEDALLLTLPLVRSMFRPSSIGTSCDRLQIWRWV
jgi:hypothetical protein